MARQRDAKLVGTFGNLIFYNHLGDYRIRTRPISVKRTPASVKSGLNFGKASKTSRQIRTLIAPINPSKSDGRASYRFTGALNKFISWREKQDTTSPSPQNGLPFIQGFQFNNHSDLTEISAIQISVNSVEPGDMEIRLAPFVPWEALHAPFNTDHILFRMIFTNTDLTVVETERLGTTEMKVPLTSEIFQPPVLHLSNSKKMGNLMMLVLSVHFMVKRKNGVEMLTDMKKLPCGVVWAGLMLKL